MTLTAHLIDLHQRRTYPARITVSEGRIATIEEVAAAPERYILPGFVDAHVHIESSMLTPAAFGRAALRHGTVATVSDPHEIANVCGVAGVEWMLENAQHTPLKIFFGAPSCVPATTFETAGATLDSKAVAALLQRPDIWYLTEVMNYPGVLNGDPEVLAKIAAARASDKPVDGHAPGLRGEAAALYAGAGISTDHECTTLEEALDKIAAGMHILIREGSAAKNFDALHPLLRSHPGRAMLCSDDKHPDDLQQGHINELAARALRLGYDRYDVLRAACVNPVLHYGLPAGLLRVGDPADFVVVEDPVGFRVSETWINGACVFRNGQVMQAPAIPRPINHFHCRPLRAADFAIAHPADGPVTARAIVAMDGQLLTRQEEVSVVARQGKVHASPQTGLLKIAVVNRYRPDALPAAAFIKGFGLKEGALAASVAHDCHNILAVGCDDESIATAVNAVVDMQGGLAVASSHREIARLPLPIAGLMSDADCDPVAAQYQRLDRAAKDLGSTLNAPFMTLSFMALLVIPALKLSDQGLFDGTAFRFVPVVEGA